MTHLPIEQLVAAITRDRDIHLSDGARLKTPTAPQPFISPKLRASESANDAELFKSEVILVSSPAAVGKSTAARHLASVARVPLLDLAEVHVSTNALVGLLTMDVADPESPIEALHRGELTVVIDALDEGRMLSGDANFEQFLATSWELLRKNRSVEKRPKLVLFGREEAADLVNISLQLDAEDLSVSWLRLDFFDQDDAVDVIEAHATETAQRNGESWSPSAASREVIDAFFVAVASALRIGPSDLWTDAQGRAFAGYAPVLAAIGSLLARQDNPIKLRNDLRASGAERAWGVIEHVADTILNREHEEKVAPQLARELAEVPPQAYDRTEQLTYLTQMALGKPLTVNSRVPLTGKDLETYRRMVSQNLPDHPFLQQGKLANEVLTAIVLASAIGGDLVDDADLTLFRESSRQPFLWRSVQRWVTESDGVAIAGRYVGCVLNSLWNDAYAETYRVRGRPDSFLSSLAEFRFDMPDGGWTMLASHPVEFYEQLKDFDGEFRGDVALQGHHREQESASFDIRGDVTMLARAVDVRANAVRVDGDARVSAERLTQGPNLRLFIASNSGVWWGGDFAKLHPWSQYEASLEPPHERPTTSVLEALVRRLSVSLPPGAPLTLNRGTLALTEDERTAWIHRDFDRGAFAEFIRLMINKGFARAQAAPASGPHPMVRIHFDVGWDVLLRALRRPDLADPEVRDLVAAAAELFE